MYFRKNERRNKIMKYWLLKLNLMLGLGIIKKEGASMDGEKLSSRNNLKNMKKMICFFIIQLLKRVL